MLTGFRIILLAGACIFLTLLTLISLSSRLPSENTTFQVDNGYQIKPPVPKDEHATARDVQVRQHREIVIRPGEKFLSYWTHSGYHNQRIALENGLLLAKMLNRTLLLPPLFLGTPVPYAEFNRMYERLMSITKKGLEHCTKVPSDYPIPAECLNYYLNTKVSWEFLVDMEPIRKWHNFIERWDMSVEWLRYRLGITPGDTYQLQDRLLWDYRIFDTRNSTIELDKYVRSIFVEDLKRVDHKLIQMGSLFGTFRVVPDLPENLNHLKFIKEHIISKNAILTKLAARIVDKIGGAGNFIGLHMRVGDGFFMRTARMTIDRMYHTIIDTRTDLPPDVVDKLEGGTHNQDILEDETVDLNKRAIKPLESENFEAAANDVSRDSRKTRRAVVPIARPKLRCHKELDDNDPGVNTVIYIATDAKMPRNNSLLFKFFNTFPCVFVLDDFQEELNEIKPLRNIEDKVPLASHLIPMLDAMIVAHAETFYGTPKSTFSTYVSKQLQPIYAGNSIDIVVYS